MESVLQPAPDSLPDLLRPPYMLVHHNLSQPQHRRGSEKHISLVRRVRLCFCYTQPSMCPTASINSHHVPESCYVLQLPLPILLPFFFSWHILHAQSYKHTPLTLSPHMAIAVIFMRDRCTIRKWEFAAWIMMNIKCAVLLFSTELVFPESWPDITVFITVKDDCLRQLLRCRYG
jgi:hypothetical protein